MAFQPIVLFASGLMLTVVYVGPSAAQGSFFDRGRDLLGSLGGGSPTSALSDDKIASGLREALRVGTERVVSSLGTEGGFNDSADVHIPLPATLQTVQQTLDKFGMGALGKDLETRLNRSAEAAVPQTKALFWEAIQEMTLEDVRGIYNGPDDAATQYFREKMSGPLAVKMKPIVDHELSNVGAIQAYDGMIGQYKTIPFVPDAKANLTDYVLEKAIDGVFLYLGREEAAIRADPTKRTTELLQSVFGR